MTATNYITIDKLNIIIAKKYNEIKLIKQYIKQIETMRKFSPIIDELNRVYAMRKFYPVIDELNKFINGDLEHISKKLKWHIKAKQQELNPEKFQIETMRKFAPCVQSLINIIKNPSKSKLSNKLKKIIKKNR